MSAETLEKRVVSLETEMKELRELPSRVADLGLQIVQLRVEMHDEFSAVRNEIRAGDDKALGLIEKTRTEMRTLGDGLRTDMRSLEERLRTEMRAVDASLRAEMRAADASLRVEMRSLNEETLSLMRVLHEDVIGRLTLIQELQAPRGTRGKKGPRKRSR